SSLIIPYSTLGDNCSPFQQVVQFDFRLLILDAWRRFRILPQIPLNRRVRQHLTIGFFYLLLALLLTWPTVSHLTSHLPGDGGDDPAIAWNLWWVKHALLVEGQSPFHTDYMFYPI